ncbi:hypothetical protein SAY86_024348 [Trapa natans]|uniref:Uncharacterized protein n=1 Tax=Trapa natans TaxID=22666 RepID=A0AAN7MUA8_TRANT|nr:hypothetical protein SAY86_024348 [Trapa natans]
MRSLHSEVRRQHWNGKWRLLLLQGKALVDSSAGYLVIPAANNIRGAWASVWDLNIEISNMKSNHYNCQWPL